MKIVTSESMRAIDSECIDNIGIPGLKLMAQIVHGADIAAAQDKHPISDGLEALAVGYSILFPSDLENLEKQFLLYDALYAWCRLQTKSSR